MKYILAIIIALTCLGLVKVRASNCNKGYEYNEPGSFSSQTCYLLTGR